MTKFWLTVLLFIPSLIVSQMAKAVCYQDPIIIDLAQDGLTLGPKGRTVLFDLAATGQPIEMQWVAIDGNDAFLAIDKNGNGIVDDGAELFTNYGYLYLDGATAENGFVDLAQYDHLQLGGNNDGYISYDDGVWSQLLLWLDNNADGVSTPDEMMSLQSVGLTRFDVIPKVNTQRQDQAGNLIPLWSWAYNDNASTNNKFRMYDVFFADAQQ